MRTSVRQWACPSCGAPRTRPLREIEPAVLDALGRFPEVGTEVPVGTWTLRPSDHQRPDHPVVVHLLDLLNVVPHPDLTRSIGCCGISHRAGQPNLICARCEAEAGYELSDGDHCAHAAFLPACVAHTEEVGLPALRREVPPTATVAHDLLGFDALPASLRHEEHLLYDAESPRHVDRVHAVDDLEAAIDGERLLLGLDGSWLAPPWPRGERRRILALRSLPLGTPQRPVTYWCDDAEGQRHEWLQWRVGDQVCAGWARYDRHHVCMFRVDAEYWDLTWEQLLGPSAVLCR